MDIQFHWTTQVNSVDQKIVEDEISAILQDSDVQPCHPGEVSVSLGIVGRLDEKFIGLAKCQCGEPFGTFKGEHRSRNVRFTPSRKE